MLLAGDPIERAVAASALGSPSSPATVAARVGLLLNALVEDTYPGVRATAWRALRRLLAAQPGLAVPAPRAFTATDPRATRAQQVLRLREGLPRARAREPDAHLVTKLRPLAQQVAIAIGE